MKHRRLPIAVTLLLALFVGYAAAAGGSADDPLISLDYLKNTFSPAAESAAQEKLDAAGQRVYDAAAERWQASVAEAETLAGAERARVWTETRLKHGDALSTLTGSQVLLLAGEASVRYFSGAVVDATDGTVLSSGGELKHRHRYLVAEDTTALFTVALSTDLPLNIPARSIVSTACSSSPRLSRANRMFSTCVLHPDMFDEPAHLSSGPGST